MSWWWGPIRAVEATPAQIVATGAGYGYGAVDPIDGDTGYRRAGGGSRAVPEWTLERARTHAVAAYRSNPMAAAIVDTIVAFAVGDSGVSPTVTNDKVREVVDEFWNDPRNRCGAIQEVGLRSQLLLGEKGLELLVGAQSGVVRFAPIDPLAVERVEVHHGNPLWPARIVFESTDPRGSLAIAQVDDKTGLRDGRAMWWAPWRTLDTDVRGMPYITTALDWLDSYDMILSNLIDRTALSRYMVWDVTVQGGQTEVDAFIQARGGVHAPSSGSVEVHNESVAWEPKSVSTGAMEDTKANGAVLTSIAAGAGLAKTWLADPEDSNRATSQTMAEPVRRRVGALQRVWLEQQTELVRFAVDRAVASGRLAAKVKATDPRTGATSMVPASQCVLVTGPEIAAADAQIGAQVLLNLSTGLEKLVEIGALTKESATLAARKGWEDYMGVPYRAELDKPDADPNAVAGAVAAAQPRPGVSPGVVGPAAPAAAAAPGTLADRQANLDWGTR